MLHTSQYHFCSSKGVPYGDTNYYHRVKRDGSRGKITISDYLATGWPTAIGFHIE